MSRPPLQHGPVSSKSRASCLPSGDHVTSRAPLRGSAGSMSCSNPERSPCGSATRRAEPPPPRSEEHTSELQSLRHLLCRLLLEIKEPGHNTTEPDRLR